METLSALLAHCEGNPLHRSPGDSPHKGQWGGALMFSLNCAWTKVWTNNRDVGDLRRHLADYDLTVMITLFCLCASAYCWLYIVTFHSSCQSNCMGPRDETIKLHAVWLRLLYCQTKWKWWWNRVFIHKLWFVDVSHCPHDHFYLFIYFIIN